MLEYQNNVTCMGLNNKAQHLSVIAFRALREIMPQSNYRLTNHLTQLHQLIGLKSFFPLHFVFAKQDNNR
jgi:hypothetical protein